MAEKPTFEIGLTMAGAVSAGAYTAGVVDFLFEALDAIEDVRAGRDTRYLKTGLRDEAPIIDPPHDVRLKALSGTSAGSMITAIVATILGTRVPPVTTKRAVNDTKATGNPLYDCWVNDIHYDKLLSTSDIDKKEELLSLLNSKPLDDILENALLYANKTDYPRPYVLDELPVFFCVSNLRGVRYGLKLNSGSGVPAEHQMSLHADWVQFQWGRSAGTGVGGPVRLQAGKNASDWKRLGDAALASGAFPVGLSARGLFRDFGDYEQRQWYDRSLGKTSLHPPIDKRDNFKDGKYDFVNADGGVFNNEPLELCRVALSEGPDKQNKRDPLEATRGVILIDPFPNLFELEEDYDVKQHSHLLDVIKNLVGAMVSQARFKLDELALADDDNVASRYAIMPVRYKKNGEAEKYSIACGSLGGFGGFLSKEFRHFDFMLGRRNCQRFLSRHFALPADWVAQTVNPLFVNWQGKEFTAAFQFVPESEPGDRFAGKKYLPIVPLLGKLASSDYTELPPWPTAPADLKAGDLKKKVLKRADAIKDALVAQYKPSTAFKAGIASYWWLKKDDWVQRFAIDKVRVALDERKITMP